MPQVTVCIPTYNRRDYLGAALDSVFAQTCRDFEVLVVDDGSTDDTEAMIARYPHPLRYIRQENRGEPAARNRLLAETHTPLVAWLDSDDLWLPDKLERQMALLAGRHADTLVYGPKISIDADGRDVGRPPRHSPSGRVTTDLFEHIFIALPSVVAPADMMRRLGGFDERYPVLSDYRLWLRMSLECDFLATPEAVVKCRRHGSNISDPTARTQRIKVSVLEEFYNDLGGRDAVPADRARRRLSRECRKAADMARRAGDRDAAVAFARKALACRLTPRTLWTRLAASCAPRAK